MNIMKKNNISVVKYTSFERTKEIEKYLLFLSNLSKLNMLLEKNLITQGEYEKVKCTIEKFA